eukprot:XP_011661787.1 PREDICTED: soluble scavenger receptor cysteine-rich domain-containing protein SSC5D isoform X1 [Strongylocentrotus purpuratus]
MEDATVVCRQWGYPRGAITVRYFEERYGHSNGPWVLSSVKCTGTEAKLTDCPAGPWGYTRCSRNREAGVMCKANPKENDIRLMSAFPTLTRLGRLEVYHEGTWGNVCNQDDFDLQSASVACKQWGFRYGAYAIIQSLGRYGSGSGRFWLSTVRCVGTEAKLADCPADPWGQNQCSRDQTTGIICRGDRGGQVTSRGLDNMTEEEEEEAYAEKDEDFLQYLKEEEEAYAEKDEDFLQNLKEEEEAYAEKDEDFLQNLKEEEAYAEKDEDFLQNLKVGISHY